MRPTRWRRSTHVLVGVGVLLAVAVLVTVAAVFVAGGPRTSEAQAVDPQPEPAAAEPAVYGLDESAPKPAPTRLSAVIGPFARIRPGSVLGEKSKVGNFVELKKAAVGPGAIDKGECPPGSACGVPGVGAPVGSRA